MKILLTKAHILPENLEANLLAYCTNKNLEAEYVIEEAIREYLKKEGITNE